MPEKIEVDKDFLFKVLHQVDGLTLRVAELEKPMSIEKFVGLYN